MKAESEVQAECRLIAPYCDLHLFRNNSGAFTDETGRLVRYGLANDSKALNKKVKSGDLVGWQLTLVTPEMVGRVLPVFASFEIKPEDWKPPRPGTREFVERYEPQLAWINLVLRAGGRAKFVTNADQLIP